MTFDRRTFLQALSATAALSLGMPHSALAANLKLGTPQSFNFETLIARAKARAQSAYQPPARPNPEIVERIDYDAHGKIKFKPEYALWAEGPSDYPVTFFHLGRFFQKTVRMHVVEAGQAREIMYSPTYFDMPADSPAMQMSANSGFAGFRFQESRKGELDWKKNDWVAFLGASYFRAIGELYQYGLSARGVAVDVAVHGKNEEFPDFTHVYLETPTNPGTIVVMALLDGPSLSGAFKFTMQRGKSVIMDVESSLFIRSDIARLGIAPLTSMYWFSEKAKPTAIDWRPEIHDSDGLELWTGSGERIWRPLNNPSRITASTFSDENPRGFGLMQRDRVFDHYQDGVHYERRPSLWIEPLGQWGKGSVQLVEIPTDDEIHDNIVAHWTPEAPVKAGQNFNLRYRLHWTADEPYPLATARCVATRMGNGGQAGTARPKGVRKFMVEFLGGPLVNLPKGVLPQIMLSASRGTFSEIRVEAVPDDVPGHWRAQFDLTVAGGEPVEMRAFLKANNEIASETWAYQYVPF